MGDLLPITGIGSLPFENAAQGLEFVRAHSPHFPYVPQFPRLGRFEEMTLEPFQAAKDFIEERGRAAVKKGRLEEMLRECASWDPVRKITHDFLSQSWSADVEVKTQIIGPYTLSTQLLYAGSPILEIDVGRELILRRLTAIATAEIALLREKFSRVTFVFDEPGLAFLKKKDVLKATKIAKEICSQLKSDGTQLGIHSCAPLPGDPSAALFREVGYQVLALAFEPLRPLDETVSKEYLNAHLKSGGRIIWGILPTSGIAVSAEDVAAAWLKELRTLDAPLPELVQHSALSPACGLGLVNADKAAEVFSQLEKVRKLILAEMP